MSLKTVDFYDKKVLVTGGAGFIGSNLCEELLKRNCSVVCLDDFSTGKRENVEPFLQDKRFTLIEGTITDLNTCKKACEGVEYVSHQAAWGSVPRSIRMPLLYEEINIRGTLNMMEAAANSGVRRFVYASSSSVYGDSSELPKKEERVGNVLSPYALTKKADEEYARQYYLHYGLKPIGFRYFNVFGRRQDPDGAYAAVIPKFIKALTKKERPVIHGDGKQSRDFTYIDNVLEANLRGFCSAENAAGQVYNVAYGGRVDLLEILSTLETLMGVKIEPEFGPERSGDIKHSHADISKARKLLGYDPEYSFAEGIRLALEWYKKVLR